MKNQYMGMESIYTWDANLLLTSIGREAIKFEMHYCTVLSLFG